jgi:hypothetical protein
MTTNILTYKGCPVRLLGHKTKWEAIMTLNIPLNIIIDAIFVSEQVLKLDHCTNLEFINIHEQPFPLPNSCGIGDLPHVTSNMKVQSISIIRCLYIAHWTQNCCSHFG